MARSVALHLLDANALIALAQDEPAQQTVERLLRTEAVAISGVNLAEARDNLIRAGQDPERVNRFTDRLFASGMTLVPVSRELADRAGELRARHYNRKDSAISIADCFLLASARSDDIVVTSDALLLKIAKKEKLSVLAIPNSHGKLPT